MLLQPAPSQLPSAAQHPSKRECRKCSFTAAKGKGGDSYGTSIFITARNFSTDYLFWVTGLNQCSKEAQPHQQDVHPTHPMCSPYSGRPLAGANPLGKLIPSSLAAPESELCSCLLLGYTPCITSYPCTAQCPTTLLLTDRCREREPACAN